MNEVPKQTGWVGIDLDRTLAYSDDNRVPGTIGAPIFRMVEFVKYKLAMGYEVRIFTARVASDLSQIPVIQDWLEKIAGLPRLQVTCCKDKDCVLIVDDIAQQAIENTGMIVQPPSAEVALQNHKPVTHLPRVTPFRKVR